MELIKPEDARLALAKRDKGDRWVPVGGDIARRHPLHGFGGWLVLVQIYVIVSILAHILLIVIALHDLYVSGPMQKGTEPSADLFTLVFLGYSALMVVLFSITLIFLYSRKYAAFASIYALVFALKTVTLTALTALYGVSILAYAVLVPLDVAVSLSVLLYILFSARANVTIGGRLRHHDGFWREIESAAAAR